jgi:hypothetical protein
MLFLTKILVQAVVQLLLFLWVKLYASFALREGLLVKRADGKLLGSKPLTRADATVMMYRLFNKL